MREDMNAKRLRLWKIRQEQKGYDVSNVHTLAEAERYFDNPVMKEETSAPIEETTEILNNINIPSEEGIVDLASMTNKELVEYGNTLGLKLNVFTKKVELIATIEEALKGTEVTSPVEERAEESTEPSAENKENSPISETDTDVPEGVEDIEIIDTPPVEENNNVALEEQVNETTEGE